MLADASVPFPYCTNPSLSHTPKLPSCYNLFGTLTVNPFETNVQSFPAYRLRSPPPLSH